jgi:hypothetical protein
MFALVDQVLLRQLPVERPTELVPGDGAQHCREGGGLTRR